MDIKVEVKDEFCFLDSCSENEKEFFTKDGKKVKAETVTSVSNCHIDIKTEIAEVAEVSSLCSMDQRELSSDNPVVRYNKSEIDTKIEIKEEQWWLQGSSTLTSCSYDSKDRPEEDFISLEAPRLQKVEFCSYISELFSNEDLGNNTSFNMRKCRPECTSAIKCQNQKCVCSETPDGGKIVSMPSCLKHNNLLQQRNTSKQDKNEEKFRPVSNNRAYKCDICQIIFNYWFQLENHRLVHDSKEVNKSEDFEQGFALLQHSELHKLKHKSIKPHTCNICNKTFTKLQDLKRHKLIHEGIRPHKCNICNNAFTQLQDLKRHKLIHEGKKPYKCNICHKAFTISSTLKRHKLTHEGIKPHNCSICNKAFSQLQHLKKHQLNHEGIKQHKCNICNKAFTDLSILKRHKLIHEGIKPHDCNICHKAFTLLPTLKRHKLIHEGIRPHKCIICQKAFTQLQDLKTHKLIHEGIKPHNCNICNKAFTQLSTLKRHKLIHVYKKQQ